LESQGIAKFGEEGDVNPSVSGTLVLQGKLSVGFAAPQHQSIRLLTFTRTVDSAPLNPEIDLERAGQLDRKLDPIFWRMSSNLQRFVEWLQAAGLLIQPALFVLTSIGVFSIT
jgi:hypothetical protein